MWVDRKRAIRQRFTAFEERSSLAASAKPKALDGDDRHDREWVVQASEVDVLWREARHLKGPSTGVNVGESGQVFGLGDMKVGPSFTCPQQPDRFVSAMPGAISRSHHDRSAAIGDQGALQP